MKYLFFLFTTVHVWSINQSDLQDYFINKEYSKIVKSFKRNPGAFQNSARLNILGQAQMKLGQAKQAVKSCAKAMLQQPYKQCAGILRNLRKNDKEIYHASLADFYHQNGDHEAAFNKYFRLYQKHSKNDEYIIGLIKVMMSMDHIDTAQELVWQLGKKNKKSAHYRGLLKFRHEVLKREKQQIDEEAILNDPASSYKILLLSQAEVAPHFDVLIKYYESGYNDPKIELGDMELMYLANLYLIKQDYQSVKEIVDNYGDGLVQPRAQISLESLLSRLPEEPKQADVDSQKVDQSNDNLQAASNTERNIGTKQVESRFIPLDLSELDLATPGDLDAYTQLSNDYNERMSQMKTYTQKRWLYEQVSDKLTEMWSHHVDPSKHAIAAYFETPKGKEFLDEMESKHAYYEKEDKRNAKMFNGRLSKLDTKLRSSVDRQSKINLLHAFKREWSTYQNSSNASVRGAWKMYLQSGEGIRLLKRVKREIREHNLTGGKIGYSGVTRQY